MQSDSHIHQQHRTELAEHSFVFLYFITDVFSLQKDFRLGISHVKYPAYNRSVIQLNLSSKQLLWWFPEHRL